MNQGTIVQSIGAVIDIEFPREAMPKVYDALVLEDSGEGGLVEKGLTFEVEQQRVIDLGHRVARELDVGDRADALDDGALGIALRRCHGSLPQTAAAPPTISESSLVIPAWRFLL